MPSHGYDALALLCLIIIAVCSLILTLHFTQMGPSAKVLTRPVRVKQPRDGDTGHIISGIGFTWECACGARGQVRTSWNAAMQDGRDHAAGHESEDAA